MKSKIYLEEKVSNQKRKATANPYYFPCRVKHSKYFTTTCLFTWNQIQEGLERAQKNPEDIPKKTFKEKLFEILDKMF
jgi:hypothetical protein